MCACGKQGSLIASRKVGVVKQAGILHLTNQNLLPPPLPPKFNPTDDCGTGLDSGFWGAAFNNLGDKIN